VVTDIHGLPTLEDCISTRLKTSLDVVRYGLGELCGRTDLTGEALHRHLFEIDGIEDVVRNLGLKLRVDFSGWATAPEARRCGVLRQPDGHSERCSVFQARAFVMRCRFQIQITYSSAQRIEANLLPIGCQQFPTNQQYFPGSAMVTTTHGVRTR